MVSGQKLSEQKLSKQKLWAVAGSVLVVVVLAVTATLGVLFAQARATENARNSALAAAQLYAQKMFSFSPETVSDNINFMMEHLTGKAKEDYEKNVVEHRIAEQTKEQKVVATVTDQGSGVIENTRNTAKVLLFVNSSATQGTSGNVDVTPARVVFTMDKRGGTWLVNNVELINDETFRDLVGADGVDPDQPRESIPVTVPESEGQPQPEGQPAPEPQPTG